MTDTTTGVLELLSRGGGVLRDPARSFRPQTGDPFVPATLIQHHALVAGATVTGATGPGRQGPQLVEVESVCGLAPVAWRARTPFANLLAINPERRFRVGDGGNPSMRILELIAPIGHGTRGLIVAPPKTGKTRLLEELAVAIHADSPEARIVMLLIDERPEEVTHFRRNVPAEVLASSSDLSVESHVRLAELCLAQVRCELECGHDVVVLVDSITRMGRAFNAHGTSSRHTLTGGLDSRALEIPRKFFGMARNVEHGGSITVVATALVETGSRMDDLIFEEFKGTGNMELVLDRQLADRRVFPAINLRTSGTRRDELLYSGEELQALNLLRRRAVEAQPVAAMEGMLKLIEKYPTNDELLRSIRPAV
ncbi:MAG TPA: transcription termination factor Rho [Candidatus Krumholzibacteria bacterium]|nr:transcription termination factor Rho [Candidatus Krumholzibacteria bacterium]HPD70156.1 transcription termination factor Rho [Candidatus Krumholzibacteria bacterium]HRY40144.1 transcription termination factor Rho [Candidatus Krumholzibacteria bacterium]